MAARDNAVSDSGFWVKTLPVDVRETPATEDARADAAVPEFVEKTQDTIEELPIVETVENRGTVEEPTPFAESPENLELEIELADNELDQIEDLPEIDAASPSEEDIDAVLNMPADDTTIFNANSTEMSSVEQNPSQPADLQPIDLQPIDLQPIDDEELETADLEFDQPPFEEPTDLDMADSMAFDKSSQSPVPETSPVPEKTEHEPAASAPARAPEVVADAPSQIADTPSQMEETSRDDESDIDADAVLLEEPFQQADHLVDMDEEDGDISRESSTEAAFNADDPELDLDAFLSGGRRRPAKQKVDEDAGSEKYTQLEQELANIRSELDTLRRDLAALRSEPATTQMDVAMEPAPIEQMEQAPTETVPTIPAEQMEPAPTEQAELSDSELSDIAFSEADELSEIDALPDAEELSEPELSEADMIEMPDETIAHNQQEAQVIPPADSGFFDSDAADEAIALSDDELDNIMNTADFSERESLNLPDTSTEIPTPEHIQPETIQADEVEDITDEIATHVPELPTEMPFEGDAMPDEIPDAMPDTMDTDTMDTDTMDTDTMDAETMDAEATHHETAAEQIIAAETALADTPPVISSLPEDVAIAQEVPEKGTSIELRRDELRSIIGYLDQLFGNLPEEKVEEFATSHYFALYKDLFEELDLEKS